MKLSINCPSSFSSHACFQNFSTTTDTKIQAKKHEKNSDQVTKWAHHFPILQTLAKLSSCLVRYLDRSYQDTSARGLAGAGVAGHGVHVNDVSSLVSMYEKHWKAMKRWCIESVRWTKKRKLVIESEHLHFVLNLDSTGATCSKLLRHFGLKSQLHVFYCVFLECRRFLNPLGIACFCFLLQFLLVTCLAGMPPNRVIGKKKEQQRCKDGSDGGSEVACSLIWLQIETRSRHMMKLCSL